MCQKLMLASNQSLTIFTVCADSPFCWKTQSSNSTEGPFLHMEVLLFQKFPCRQQGLACSPVQSKPEHCLPVQCYHAGIMIVTKCLVVDTLRCSETSFPNVTARSFHLLKIESMVTVFSSEKIRI